MIPPVWDHIVYRCIIGSRAYGLETEASDVDRRGFFLPPADAFWSLDGVPEQIEKDETQECYWEVGKFLRLGLKANPQILECLYTGLIEHETPLVRELLEMRGAFLSKEIARTCDAYAVSQFNKVEHDRRTKGAIKWKHAMHLVRILLLGLSALRENKLRIDVGEHRERLLAIKRGELAWAEVDQWRRELHEAYAPALRGTRLPDLPDKERVEAWLLTARRASL
jgi:uncharacterized protein